MAVLEFLPSATALSLCVAAAAILWVMGVVVYRIFFHPLAHVPGPYLAATTYLYSFRYNLTGRFYLQIENLHQQYGPVIRIGPNEVHLSDPENYEKIYYVGSKFWKSPQFYDALGLNTSTFGTSSNELHRIRRSALNPLFSRKRVLELEHVVQSKVDKLCNRISEGLKNGQPVDLHNGFRSISVDVITDYAFDNCYNLLNAPDLGKSFLDTIKSLAPRIWIVQQFPLALSISQSIPPWLSGTMNKSLATFMAVIESCKNEIKRIKNSVDAGEKPPERITIFHQLLDPNAAGGHVVPGINDLETEAFAFLGAAADTTGATLTTAAYHAISNEDIYRKLRDELKTAFPDTGAKLDFLTLEKLPYLTAVIKEGLRLAFSVPGRLPRIVPTPGIEFNGVFLPEGTSVGMSSWQMHRDPSIWLEPMKFSPDRWLEPDASQKLDKYFIPFGKGSRQCIGMPLAFCELYVTLGTMVRRFENLNASEMAPEDFDFVDYFGAYWPDMARRFHVQPLPII